MSNFQERFETAMPEIPEGIDFELEPFLSFDEKGLLKEGLRNVDIEFLISEGWPCEAAPFLDFFANNYESYSYIKKSLPEGYYPLGSNNSGDSIVIEIENGSVILIDHEDTTSRVFINSSLSSFAESLCIYAECRKNNELKELRNKIGKVDSSSINENTMWFHETKESE